MQFTFKAKLLRFTITCELWNSIKPQQRFTFFAAVNHLSGPLGKQKLTSTGSKGCIFRSWLVDFDPFCLFSPVFQRSLTVTIIMIDGSEKHNCQLGFELQGLHVIENLNKSLPPMCKVNSKQTHCWRCACYQ